MLELGRDGFLADWGVAVAGLRGVGNRFDDFATAPMTDQAAGRRSVALPNVAMCACNGGGYAFGGQCRLFMSIRGKYR